MMDHLLRCSLQNRSWDTFTRESELRYYYDARNDALWSATFAQNFAKE